jgi:glycerol 2-dehydrogenase (NADP+)
MDLKVVKDIARFHASSPSAVLLSWAVQRGITVIPKSCQKSRIEGNMRLITLSQAELSALNSVHESERLRLADHIPPLQLVVEGKQTIRGWSKVEIGWENEEGEWLT